MTKKIVYIAHPIGGDVENNIKKVVAICREVNLTEPNIIPFVPYLSDLYALNDEIPVERERGLSNGLFMLKKGFIDEIWLYGDRISNGMRAEINICLEVGIKVVCKTAGTAEIPDIEKDFDKDMERYEESLYCSECGNDDKKTFNYSRTVANGEVWNCKICDKENLTPEKPNADLY